MKRLLVFVCAVVALTLATSTFAQVPCDPDPWMCYENADPGSGGGDSGVGSQSNMCPAGHCCACAGSSGCQDISSPYVYGSNGSTPGNPSWGVYLYSGSYMCFSYAWYCKQYGGGCDVYDCTSAGGACPPEAPAALSLDFQGHQKPEAISRTPYDVMSRQTDAALSRVLLPAIMLALRNHATDAGTVSMKREYEVYVKAAEAATGLKLAVGEYLSPKGTEKMAPLPMEIQRRVAAAIDNN